LSIDNLPRKLQFVNYLRLQIKKPCGFFFFACVLPAKHKRPEGQNLRGCDKSVVDFEVDVFGVVGLPGGQPALVSEVLAGSPIVGFWT